ncbi:MAG: hypothetical protein ABFC34_03615 [Methanobacterium sp.]
MFDKYPSKIETLIESEKIYEEVSPLLGETVTKIYNEKLYVINGNLSIKDCLVFDKNKKLLDSYSTITSNNIYEGKFFLEWMK